MNKLKLLLVAATITGLFACSRVEKPISKPTKKSSYYLKEDISPAELNNAANYKRYYYHCRNFETGSRSSLVSYFPLSRESRLKDNFGFYFQLDGTKPEPFDHLENKSLNAKGTRFEVTYRSYRPIQGSIIDLVARERSSIYYKTINGSRTRWLECREG